MCPWGESELSSRPAGVFFSKNKTIFFKMALSPDLYARNPSYNKMIPTMMAMAPLTVTMPFK